MKTAIAVKRSKSMSKKKRKVTFTIPQKKIITTIQPCSIMTEEERRRIWYHQVTSCICIYLNFANYHGSQVELNKFKNDTRSIIKLMKIEHDEQQIELQKSNVKLHHKNIDSQDFQCLRGLEHRISFERQRKKYFAIKGVLEAQKIMKQQGIEGSNHSRQLAKISSRLTSSAREYAIEDATFDACINEAEIIPSYASNLEPSTRSIISNPVLCNPIKRVIKRINLDDLSVLRNMHYYR